MVEAENPLENFIRHLGRIANFNGVTFTHRIEIDYRGKEIYYYLVIESREEGGELEPFLFESGRCIDIAVERAVEILPKTVNELGLTWVD